MAFNKYSNDLVEDWDNEDSNNTIVSGTWSRGGRGGGGGAQSSYSVRPNTSCQTYNMQHNTLVIKVDSNKVGIIIGKGGSKIRDLQYESGAQISIGQKLHSETNINLVGTSEAQSRAQSLILDLISQNYRSNYKYNNNSIDSKTETQSYCDSNYNQVQVPPPINENKPFVPIDWQGIYRASLQATMEKWAKLPAVVKEFYVEDPEVANMSPEMVAQIRMENNNTMVSRFEKENSDSISLPIPNPVQTFEQCFGMYPDILNEIQKQGFVKPTPIQAQAWPVLLSGQDLIGIAQTGSGKTLAFILPALIHIDGQTTKPSGPTVLVLAPTRELALQIEKEVVKYRYKGIKAVCIYGGGSRRDQIEVISKGIQIVIATPGRLNDLVNAKVIDLISVTYLVLDEADRMLDLGFEPQIRKILLDIRPQRQTIMTSATWPSGVRRLAESYMNSPVQVFIGSMDLAAVHSVTQKIIIIDENDKFNAVVEFARSLKKDEKAIIFCGKKATTDFLSAEFCCMHIECSSIHGGRDQADREQALDDIKTGYVNILIATDIASRGIDIEDITHVLNYDFPRNIEEYVHRVGRTGRAGKSGTSISYITRADWSQAKDLIAILEEANQEVPHEIRHMSQRFQANQRRRKEEKARAPFDANEWMARPSTMQRPAFSSPQERSSSQGGFVSSSRGSFGGWGAAPGFSSGRGRGRGITRWE